MKAFLLGLLSIFWSTLAMGQNLYTFNGGGTTGLWTDAGTWTTDPTGSTSINARQPTSSDNVVVTNSFVVTLGSALAAGATPASITIQRGGVLDLNTSTAGFASALTRLAGQGTLRIGRPYFPAVTNNDFDDANTGTVEFYNWPTGATDLPQPTSTQYNNLRLLNSTGTPTTAGTAYTVQVANTVTLSGSLTLINTNYIKPDPSASIVGNIGGNVTLLLGKAGVNTSRTLNVQGTVTVGSGTNLGVAAATANHTLNVSGSFVNNGTVNLHNGTTDDNQIALLNFTGATDANFACNGPTDLGRLQVDKGIDSQVLLNVTSSVNPQSAQGNLRLNYIGNGRLLILVNGVAKFGNNVYLAKIHNGTAMNSPTVDPASGWWELGSSTTSPTLWIAGATILNDNAILFAIYGTYRISSGRLSTMTPDAMVVREDGQILIEGGTTSVNKLRPSSTSASHRGSFTMTGGTFESLGTIPFGINDEFARFSIPYLSQSFRMSGGTLRVQNPNTNGVDGLFHIGVNANNAIVTGGNIEVLLPNSNINGKILTTAPLWNLTIKKLTAGGTSKALLSAIGVPAAYASATTTTTTAQPITVLNNFTLDPTSATTFDASSQDVNIQGTLSIGTGCTYLPGTNTTKFSGPQNQLLTNNGTIGATANVGTFSNWTIDKSAGTLTLGGTVTTYYTPAGTTLSLLNGVLSDGGKTINVQGNLINSASHTSGGGAGSIVMNGATAQTIGGNGSGVFGNLKINSTLTPAGSVAVTLGANIAVSNILTLQSTHVFAIGTYRLSLTNVNTNAIGPAGGFNAQRMVQTAGNQSDLGMQKTYGGPNAFTFPVGTGTKYTPATIDLQLATGLSKYGQVSISPTNSRNPFVASTTNSLAYYWKVRSVGFGPIPTGAIYSTFQMTNTDAAGTRASYVGGRYLPVAWNTTYSGGLTDYGTYSDIAFNGLDQFDGEFTAGQPATFGPITAFYSRTNGNWTSNTTWSTSSNTGAAVPSGAVAGTNFPGAGNPVFIGSASTSVYHTVTVSANTAQSGSLVIDRGSVMDVGTTTGHNFGALPDSKIGGSGRLRVSSSAATAVFPGGDFGSFLQAGGGTVEYYTTGTRDFTVPSTSATSLSLTTYRNLWLNAASGRTITMPNSDLRVYAALRAGTPTTYPGTVLLSASAATTILRADSLIAVQAGAFRFSNGTVFNLVADTDLRIDAGATFGVITTGTIVPNTMTVGGSLTNNGTLDFNVSNRYVGLTFTGDQNASFTGPTATLTDLYTLTVNKGTGRTATLTMDVAGTLTSPTNSWLTLTNGTLRYAKNAGSQPLVIHDAASPYAITDNAGLTVDAPNAAVTVATSTNAAADLKMAGQVQVLQGTLSVGTAAGTGNDLEYASAGAPALKVAAGGTLYVNGQIRRTVSNLDGALRFEQSGGTIDIDGQGATAAQNNERGLFEVQGKGSIFRMSGGTMTLHRSNGRPTIAADLYLAPDSTVVTGGKVVLGNATAGVGNVTISANSTVPLYDLRVETGANNTNTNTGLLTGVIPLTLKGSLTIGNDNSFFNANSLGLNIYQSLINNNTSASTALNAGGFQPISATQTTSFLGGIATQLLTGTASNLTVFGGLVLNTSQTNGKLQLGGNVLTAGTLTLTKGTLDDNGKTLTALGDVLNSATHTSTGSGSIILAGPTDQSIGGNGTGRFGNLTLNSASGATTTANQEITQVLALSNGVFTIGSNLLWLSNTAAGAVTGFSSARYIRSNGIVADLGLRKSYPAGASNFTFPVATAANYTPVQMNVTSTGSTAGTVTVQPIAIPHPSTTDALNKELSYYWKVSSTGMGSPVVTQVFTYMASQVNGTEANYRLGRFLSGQWTPQGGIPGPGGSVSTTNHTLTNTGVAYIDGDYTGGEASEFGNVPTYYSRNATAGAGGANWNDPSAWTSTSNGSGPSAGSFPTLANPVVILPGHLINSAGTGRGAASLVLNGTLDLGANLSNNFSTVSGTGTLRIGSAIFPAGNYANFVAPGTGNVDFTGAVQLPARDTYNNLTLSGGNAKQLTNLDLNINGALTVAASTTVNNPTSQNITLSSPISGVTVAGTFNLNDGQLTTGAGLTTTNTGTVNLGAGAVTLGTALTNNGMLVLGSGNFTTGTSLTNGGTYDASTGAGAITVGTSFSNSGTYQAGTGNLNVGTTFTNTATGNFSAAAGEVNANSTFTNAGYYGANATNLLHANADFSIPTGGYFSAGTSTLVLRGNFINSGTFDQGNSLAQFLTDVNHSIIGSTTFWNLQKFGGNTLVMSTSTSSPVTNVTVANLLTLQNGLFYTGPSGSSNTLSLTNTATQPIIGNTLSSYVSGRLAMSLPNEAASIRVFPVGAGGRYRPVTIKPVGISSSPVVLVEIINGSPAGSVDATLSNLSANRSYRIQLLSGTINQPTVQLSFNTDVVDEAVNVPGNLRVARSNGPSGPWSTAGGGGVYSPDAPRGYTTSAATTINNNSFFALASTNNVDNPLTGSAPLPVELVQFTATLKGSAVHLDWATASEKNSAYFAVERSADGRSFRELGRVTAQGSTSLRHDYALIDAAPLTGLSYYRLRQVDNDGTLAYSPVATVRYAPEHAAPTLLAYPNPATHDGFQLAISNLTGSAGSTVQVFDNVGRLVLTQAVAPNTMQATIQPARPLASGMYFVTWTTEGAKLTTKVVVE